MRILTLTPGLILLCATSAFAEGWALGAKGGVNLATALFAGGESTLTLDLRVGPVGGVFATLPVTSWIDLQPEVLYSVKGGRRKDGNLTTGLLLEYLEVPVLVRKPFGSGRWRYYVAGGPAFGLRLRARSRVDFGDVTEEIDIGDDVKRFDLGVALGGGFESGSLVFDGRYTLGLLDIDEDTTDDVRVTSRVLSMTVGIRF